MKSFKLKYYDFKYFLFLKLNIYSFLEKRVETLFNRKFLISTLVTDQKVKKKV